MLRNADSALYKAKSNGRACYALYTEELTAHAQHRVETAAELRRALEQDELRVYFQPVHDLATGRQVGVEALVRWQHPGRGLVPPSEFIPIAERTGLIARSIPGCCNRPVGKWCSGRLKAGSWHLLG